MGARLQAGGRRGRGRARPAGRWGRGGGTAAAAAARGGMWEPGCLPAGRPAKTQHACYQPSAPRRSSSSPHAAPALARLPPASLQPCLRPGSLPPQAPWWRRRAWCRRTSASLASTTARSSARVCVAGGGEGEQRGAAAAVHRPRQEGRAGLAPGGAAGGARAGMYVRTTLRCRPLCLWRGDVWRSRGCPAHLPLKLLPLPGTVPAPSHHFHTQSSGRRCTSS